ncbi:acyl carrier protein [Verrucomicrobiota bacterium]|jgi:acyl carrier protein|nr:acyl carrier protein [Verrucomicrobiota bacterium]GDY17661.1 acyl carrier protein [Verrucomicrobiota bacterium]
MPENIEQRVKDIIVKQLGVNLEQLTPAAGFQTDLKADSLDLVEMIMAFEDEFGIASIPEDKAASMKTVGDAVEYIKANATK